MASDSGRRSRRHLLHAAGLAVASLAGCLGTDGPTTSDDRPAGRTGTPTADRTTSAPSTTDGASPTPTLDLREANVVDVAVSGERKAVEFDVTLFHDDDGEDGYANWWQVETVDGEQLGRRVLTHPHSTAPFTRSTTVGIPPGVDCVVVRGHDQTHGYGGQAVLVDLATGATRAIQQGSDRREFSPEDCPGGTGSTEPGR